MKIIKDILSHKLLFVLGIFQIAVILMLLIKLPAKRCTNELYFNSNNSSSDGTVITLDGTASLRSGAYEVIIDYNTQADAKASVSFVSEKKPSAVINDSLSLAGEDRRIYSRVWLSLGNGTDDLKMNLSSDKPCTVTHIRLREILKYRIIRIAGYFLLFVLTDALIYIFLSKKISKRTKYIIFGICAVIFLSALPDLTNLTFNKHDYRFHINRILSVADALSGGYFPVRIHFRLLHGYGFANSIFYGDIFLYFPAVLYNMGLSLQAAYKAYLICIHTGTAYIAWWCFNKLSGDYKIALFGSLVYSLSAYRVANVLIRGSLGEYTAMMFLPLICYGFMHIYSMPDTEKGKWKDSLPLCIGLTGCLQSHTLSVEMAAVFIILFCILNFKKTFAKNRFIILLKTLAVTILVNLWFIIPLLDYSRYPFKISDYKPEIYSAVLTPSEIFNAFFRHSGLSPFLGASFVAATAVFLILFIKHGGECLLTEKSKWFMGFGWLAVFMTSIYFPWKILRNISLTVYEFFSSIQFAWRYLTVATVMLTFLAVSVADYFRIRNKSKAENIFMTVIAVLCIVPVLMFYTDYASNYERITIYAENDISSDHIMDDFYLPAGTDRYKLNLTRPTSADEALTVAYYTEENHRFEVECKNLSDESKMLEFPLINYKGYVAYDAETNESLEIVNSSNNTLNVKIPKGYSGTVKVEFKEPYYWRLSEIISLFSVAVYLFACFGRRKIKRS